MADLYRPKPLEWKQCGRRDWVYSGEAWFGVSYTVRETERDGEWGWRVDGNASFDLTPCDSLESGQAAAEAHWLERWLQTAEPVESPVRVWLIDQLLAEHSGYSVYRESDQMPTGYASYSASNGLRGVGFGCTRSLSQSYEELRCRLNAETGVFLWKADIDGSVQNWMENGIDKPLRELVSGEVR